MIERRGKCRGPNCGAEILFVKTEKGKLQVLDAEPKKGVVLFTGDSNPRLRKTLAEAESTLTPTYSVVVDVFTDHHATCPDAALFEGRHPQ